jgi:hypothetical protein
MKHLGVILWALVVAGTMWSPDLFGWPFWLFPAMLVGLIALSAAFLVTRREIRFRRKGYEILVYISQSEFEYRERHEGRARTLKLRGDLIENGHLAYTRFPEELWKEKVPEWAKGRRLEIEERILEDPSHRPL